eukprot:1768507-Pleurochrysis_carterae.AAC.1
MIVGGHFEGVRFANYSVFSEELRAYPNCQLFGTEAGVTDEASASQLLRELTETASPQRDGRGVADDVDASAVASATASRSPSEGDCSDHEGRHGTRQNSFLLREATVPARASSR